MGMRRQLHGMGMSRYRHAVSMCGNRHGMRMLFQIYLKAWNRYRYTYIVGMREPMLMLHRVLMAAQRMTVGIQRMPVPHWVGVAPQAVCMAAQGMPVPHAVAVTAQRMCMPAQGMPVPHTVTVAAAAVRTAAGAAAAGIPGNGYRLAVVGGHAARLLASSRNVVRVPDGQ